MAVDYIWFRELNDHILYQGLSKTLFIGKKVVHLPACPSTNEEAVKYIELPDFVDGTLIITDHQTLGKGQRGNSWEAHQGCNLTFSVILKPTFLPVYQQFDLNTFVALGILDFLKQYGSGFQVKWPNDVYYRDKKIGGILIRNFLKTNTIGTTIIGIGLNINQTSFSIPQATSLQLITHTEHDLPLVLDDLCHCIECRFLELRQGHAKRLREHYIDNLYWFGEDHIFSNGRPFSGRIVGISEEGQLLIETNTGLQSFNFKEVTFLN